MWWLQFGLTLLCWISWIGSVVRSRRGVRETTLTMAWRWLFVAGLAVCVMASSDFVGHVWPDQTADYGWFFTAILLLCPPMAVLGSRRPGVRVWSLFILMPMVAVLSWPIWTLLLQRSEWRGLSLEAPTVLGFVLVLLMGAGNYLGTRFAIPACGYFVGVVGLLATCTGWNVVPDSGKLLGRMSAVMVLNIAALWSSASPLSVSRRHRINQVWDDFRDLFGLVWALRMVERVNSVAAQEGWTIRMSLDGFPESDSGHLTSNEAQVESACRWLFRRFVEEEWIGQRLGKPSKNVSNYN